jgi:hypothetical protein
MFTVVQTWAMSITSNPIVYIQLKKENLDFGYLGIDGD